LGSRKGNSVFPRSLDLIGYEVFKEMWGAFSSLALSARWIVPRLFGCEIGAHQYNLCFSTKIDQVLIQCCRDQGKDHGKGGKQAAEMLTGKRWAVAFIHK
jgi:hypothetical protein